MNGVFSIPLDPSLEVYKSPCSYRSIEKHAAEEHRCIDRLRARLSAYIGGPENIAAQVAAASVFEGRLHFNPLLLTGPTATGKSLAATAITHGWMRKNVHATVFSITAADFVYKYRDARVTDSLEEFRSRFQKADFICIEDIQDLAGKIEAQREFAALLDDALTENRWLIATRREPFSALSPTLMSRLNSGLVVNMQSPGLTARRELLERLADYYELPFSSLAFAEAAAKLEVTFPMLKHAVLSLGQECSSSGVIEVEHVQRYLQRKNQENTPSLRSITSCVARCYKLRVADLRGSSRKQSVVRARAMAMYLCRTLTDASLAHIGKHFGNRDHSTVLHAYHKVANDPAQNHEIQSLIEKLTPNGTKQNCS